MIGNQLWGSPNSDSDSDTLLVSTDNKYDQRLKLILTVPFSRLILGEKISYSGLM